MYPPNLIREKVANSGSIEIMLDPEAYRAIEALSRATNTNATGAFTAEVTRIMGTLLKCISSAAKAGGGGIAALENIRAHTDAFVIQTQSLIREDYDPLKVTEWVRKRTRS